MAEERKGKWWKKRKRGEKGKGRGEGRGGGGRGGESKKFYILFLISAIKYLIF